MSSVETGSDRRHKRPREDAPSALASSNFTASKDIWYEDGNIILVCESVGFRVFKGILSSQSEVFRDMFSVGKPSADETFDGCAVVNLFDSAVDALPFLRALHDRDYGRPSVYDVPRHDLPFSTVAVILRMATKYLVRGLRKEIVDDFKFIFPSTFSDLIDFHDGRSLIPDFNGIIAVNIAIVSHPDHSSSGILLLLLVEPGDACGGIPVRVRRRRQTFFHGTLHCIDPSREGPRRNPLF